MLTAAIRDVINVIIVVVAAAVVVVIVVVVAASSSCCCCFQWRSEGVSGGYDPVDQTKDQQKQSRVP